MMKTRFRGVVFGLLFTALWTVVAGISFVSPAQDTRGKTFTANRLYYAMVDGALEKWDFYKDGTFLHQGVAAGGGTSARHSERGTYQIEGNVLHLQITKTASTFLTPGTSSRGNTTQMGGATSNQAETRQMKIQLLGPDGEKGVVLNGETFKVRHWN